MLEKFEYEFNSEDAEFLLKVINKDLSSLDDYLLFHLAVIDKTITVLKRNSDLVINVDALKEMSEAYLISDKVLTLMEKRKESIHLEESKLESVKTNAKSIVNGVESIAKLNKEHLINKDALLLFFYLSS